MQKNRSMAASLPHGLASSTFNIYASTARIPTIAGDGVDADARSSPGSRGSTQGLLSHLTRTLVITAFVTVLGGSFPHGYNTGVLNAPQTHLIAFINSSFIQRFDKPPTETTLKFLWSFTVAIYLAGGILGTMVSSELAERLGRKKAILVLHSTGVVAAVLFALCKVVNSFEMLMTARLVVGFGGGAGFCLVPLYLTEVSPIEIRGSMGVLHQLALTVGILFSQLLGLEQILGTETRWPILLALTAVPNVLSMLTLPFMPDSPRYLLVNKRDTNAAVTALEKFRNYIDVTFDVDEMIEEQKQAEAEPEWTMRQLFYCKSLRRPLLVVSILALCQQFSGINVVFYYSSSIFEDANIPRDKVQFATLSTGVINVIMTIASVVLVEKSGRRKLLIGGMFGMIAAMVVITAALNLRHIASWMAYVCVVCVIGYVISFAIGLGSIPQFIGAELFKQGPRAKAMAFSGALNWVANFLVALSFPAIQSAMKAWCFLIFLGFVTASVIFIWIKMPETKNKSHAEIAKMMKIDSETEEMEEKWLKNGKLLGSRTSRRDSQREMEYDELRQKAVVAVHEYSVSQMSLNKLGRGASFYGSHQGFGSAYHADPMKRINVTLSSIKRTSDTSDINPSSAAESTANDFVAPPVAEQGSVQLATAPAPSGVSENPKASEPTRPLKNTDLERLLEELPSEEV